MAISRTSTGKSVKKAVPSKAKKVASKSPAKPAMKLQAASAKKKLAVKNVVKGKSKR